MRVKLLSCNELFKRKILSKILYALTYILIEWSNKKLLLFFTKKKYSHEEFTIHNLILKYFFFLFKSFRIISLMVKN